MKQIKFHPKLVPLVLNGSKITTWRLFDDKNLQVNDELIFLNSETLEEFAKAKICSVREKRMQEVDETDFSGHERFNSEKEMYDTYSQYYKTPINKETIVKIIGFKVIN